MAEVKRTTLAALKAVTNQDWSHVTMTEEQAREALSTFERLKDTGQADDASISEVAAEVIADMAAEAPQEGGDSEPGTDTPDDTPDAPQEASEAPTEAQAEPPVTPGNQPDKDDDRFDLERYIVTTATKHRDTILDGIELGGPASASSVTIKVPDLPEVHLDHAHMMLPTLITVCSLREAAMLVGPAGSGKTTAGSQVAEVFKVPFYANSNSPMDTYTKAFGYMDGGGEYRPGYLYTPMKHGGVLLDDEVDASNPAVTVSKNSAIENRFAYFPNGERVEAHADFIYIASANTYGRGADRLYVGRTQLDAATLDRFVNIEWDYDEELETTIACNAKWTTWVQKVRKVVYSHKMRYVVSPRASIKGGKLLAAGIPERQVRDMVVFKGWPEDDVKKVMKDL